MDERLVAAARPLALRRIAQSTDGLVFVKTHNAFVKHLGTPTIEPSVTAGAIYIVRNPLDVAISFAAFKGGDIDEAIETMTAQGAIAEPTATMVYQYSGFLGRACRELDAAPGAATPCNAIRGYARQAPRDLRRARSVPAHCAHAPATRSRDRGFVLRQAEGAGRRVWLQREAGHGRALLPRRKKRPVARDPDRSPRSIELSPPATRRWNASVIGRRKSRYQCIFRRMNGP